MKVYPEKIKAFIKRTPGNIYIVSGDEPLLVQESSDLIRRELKSAGFTEREIYDVTANFDWEQILFSANSLSLFADKKLIEIRMPGGRPGDKGAKALTQFSANPPADVVLLLITSRLDAAIQRAKWFKSLEKSAAWVSLWPIDGKNLPGWIAQRMKNAGLVAEKEVISLLCDKIEGNLLAAVQEIEKLKLTANKGRVDIKHIIEDVADSSHYDVFKLIDAAYSGNARKTIKIVRGLRNEGVEILQLLGMVARETRNLGLMASKLNQGENLDSVLRSQHVWQARKPLITRILRTHDYQTLASIHQQLSSVDRMVKGAESGNPWDELGSLLLHLSGRKDTLQKPRIRSRAGSGPV